MHLSSTARIQIFRYASQRSLGHAQLKGSTRLQGYLLDRLQGSRLGLLGKMDTYAFYRDFIGGKHDVVERKIIEAAFSDKFLNNSDTSNDMRDYKETLVQSLVKNNLVKVDMGFVKGLARYKNFPTHLLMSYLPATDTRDYFDYLIGALRQCTGWSCRDILSALEKFPRYGNDAAPALARIISDKDSFSRGEAAQTAGKLGTSSPEMMSALIDLAKSSDHWPSYYGTMALGEIGTASPDVLKMVDQGMENGAGKSPDDLSLVLGRIGKKEPKPVLELVRTWYDSPHEYKRKYASHVLGIMEEAALPEVPTLKKQLLTQPEPKKVDDPFDSGGFGKQNAELMRKLNGQGTDKIDGAEFALGVIGMKRPDVVLPIADEALSSKNNAVRKSGISMLSLMRPTDMKIIKKVMALLEDPNDEISQHASMAIGHLKPDLSLPLIFEALNSSSDKAKSRALEAIPRDTDKLNPVSATQKAEIRAKLVEMKKGASMKLQSDINYAEYRLGFSR